jgi:hypothetical protein
MPKFEQYWLGRGRAPADKIEIEKGVPIPPTKKRSKSHYRYPWREMEVGDSFYAEVDILPVRTNALHTGKLLGRKFYVRQDGTGVRVWRTG